jgi:hypothetical protein
MNGRPLTDAQISQALRAHLPEAAPAGLRERVFGAAETTAQLRPFPSFLGALSDADPIGRRRSLLIAAALLIALAVASATAVGAWRLLQRDPIDELSLEPPADLPAFVLSSRERLPQLPPVALTWHDSCAWPDCDSAKGRVYVDQSGTVRFDRFTSADATEPSSYTILDANHRISGMAPVDSEAVWVEPGDDPRFEDDPRVFLGGILYRADSSPGCELMRDQGDGDANVATGWRYVGVEEVAGRPTHRVACAGELGLNTDLWIDIETRLILRIREPMVDGAGQAVPGQFSTIEVTEIAFGEQPAALFEPPDRVTRLSAGAYLEYTCTRDLPDEEFVGFAGTRESCSTPPEAEVTPPPEPTPTPTPTPRPSVAPRDDSSGPPGPLAWHESSLNEDWPVPVRPEPAGGASVQSMPIMILDPSMPLTHLDPTGDTGSEIDPWVDIRAVMMRTADPEIVHLRFVSNEAPVVDPAEQWIAYGVVTDDDRDGVPDWRYGIDNMPVDSSDRPWRVWRTNLHTGQTDAGPVGHPDLPPPDDGPGFKSGYTRGWGAGFTFGGDFETTQGTFPWGFKLDMPFYTWASAIVNGRVVATDHAPDTGWLIATPGPKVGGTYVLEEVGGNGDQPQDYPLRLSMTVPDDWTVSGPWGYESENTHVEFGVVEYPWDLCSDAKNPKLGPSFDDLVSYLDALPNIDISEMRSGTLGGHRAVYLKYTPVDKWFDCMSANPLPEGRYNEAWILDVEGVRLVMAAVSEEAPSEPDLSEVRQIVQSIRINP